MLRHGRLRTMSLHKMLVSYHYLAGTPEEGEAFIGEIVSRPAVHLDLDDGQRQRRFHHDSSAWQNEVAPED